MRFRYEKNDRQFLHENDKRTLHNRRLNKFDLFSCKIIFYHFE